MNKKQIKVNKSKKKKKKKIINKHKKIMKIIMLVRITWSIWFNLGAIGIWLNLKSCMEFIIVSSWTRSNMRSRLLDLNYKCSYSSNNQFYSSSILLFCTLCVEIEKSTKFEIIGNLKSILNRQQFQNACYNQFYVLCMERKKNKEKEVEVKFMKYVFDLKL